MTTMKIILGMIPSRATPVQLPVKAFFLPLLVVLSLLLSTAIPTRLSAATKCGTPSEKSLLQININNIKKSDSTLYLSIYAASQAKYFPWKSEKSLKRLSFKVLGKSMIIKMCKQDLKNFAPGKYVVALFQDLNGNKKLDTNFLGIPSEPIGMSNDAKGSFGPPAFDDAAFEVKKNQTKKITINLYSY